MANSKRSKVHINLLLLYIQYMLVLVWIALMILITWFSNQPADVSTEQSLHIGKLICSIIIKDYESVSATEQLEYAQMLDHFVRKSAHFCEYAALGALTFNACYIVFNHLKIKFRLKIKKLHFAIFSVIWSLLFAISDEIHQYFVEGRYSSALDVLLDTCGAAFGIAIVLLINRLIMRSKSPSRKEGT